MSSTWLIAYCLVGLVLELAYFLDMVVDDSGIKLSGDKK